MTLDKDKEKNNITLTTNSEEINTDFFVKKLEECKNIVIPNDSTKKENIIEYRLFLPLNYLKDEKVNHLKLYDIVTELGPFVRKNTMAQEKYILNFCYLDNYCEKLSGLSRKCKDLLDKVNQMNNDFLEECTQIGFRKLEEPLKRIIAHTKKIKDTSVYLDEDSASSSSVVITSMNFKNATEKIVEVISQILGLKTPISYKCSLSHCSHYDSKRFTNTDYFIFCDKQIIIEKSRKVIAEKTLNKNVKSQIDAAKIQADDIQDHFEEDLLQQHKLIK